MEAEAAEAEAAAAEAKAAKDAGSEDAKVSVFDSSVQGGDAVWEGLRVYDGKVFMLDRHISR